MATLRQQAASRLNGMKSKGPASDRGKRASRRNALKHGLSGEGVVLPEVMAQEVAARSAEWGPPAGGMEGWLFERLVVESLRLEQCEVLERSLTTEHAQRAGGLWDEDRIAAIEVLVAALAARPSRVAAQLRTSVHGCDWIIGRWTALVEHVAATGELSPEWRSRALDWLGVPAEDRAAHPLAQPDTPAEALLDVAEAQVCDLHELKATVLEALDDKQRTAAMQGLFHEMPKSLALLHRYAEGCYRRFRWYASQLRTLGAFPTAKPAPAQKPPLPPADAPIDPEEVDRVCDRLVATLARVASTPSTPPKAVAPTPSPAPREVTPSPAPAPPLDQRERTARARKLERRRRRS